jgi:hypothetical protein
MMKHLKKINYLILILIGFMIGIIVAASIHNHDIKNIWWAHIIVVFVAILLSLTIHELTHAFVFSINKIKIKAVYLFMFMFIRKGKIFKIKVNPKLLILGGGLVVPLLPPITNDEEFKEVGNKFAKSLIAAPIASIVFGFLTFVVFLLLLFLSNNLILISIMMTATIVILILTILVILASSGANEHAAGDFVAYKKVKEEPDYLLQVVSSYMMFNPEAYELSKDYLLDKKVNYLLSRPLQYNLETYAYLIDYLENVVYEDGEKNFSLDNKIFSLNRSILSGTNEGVSVLFLIAYLHYLYGDEDRAFDIINYLEVLRNPNVTWTHLEYELKRANHLLGISDQFEYLSPPQHLDMGLNWIFEPLLENKDEKITYQKLKKGIKVPKITFYNFL